MPEYLPKTAQETIINGREIKYWNTGRFYGPNGQRMVISKPTEDSVLFIDLDRNIEGVLIDCPFTAQGVMNGYDKNWYHPIGNQDEYCVQRDLFNEMDKLKSLFTIQE